MVDKKTGADVATQLLVGKTSMRQLNRRTCQNKLRIGKINNFPSMASVLEEKLREAACVGDIEAVQALVAQNVNVNSQNSVNGWYF